MTVKIVLFLITKARKANNSLKGVIPILKGEGHEFTLLPNNTGLIWKSPKIYLMRGEVLLLSAHYRYH